MDKQKYLKIKLKRKTLWMVQCALLAAVICVLSPIAVPIGPVPITLATLVVMLTGVMLEWKQAAAAVALYVLLGAIGLPVFSGGNGGLGVLTGATGGYIWSFIAMAAIASGFSHSRRGWWMAIPGCLIALLLVYFCGTLQFTLVMQKSWAQALSVCVLPFIPVDLAKAACAIFLGLKVRARLNKAGLL